MDRSNALVAVGVLLDQCEVLLGSDHRAGVAGECHDRKDAENGIDGAALEPEVAQVGAGEERAVCFDQLGGGATALDVRVSSLGAVAVCAPRGRWLLLSRLEL